MHHWPRLQFKLCFCLVADSPVIQMDVLVSKFPLEWRGLAAALNLGIESQQCADLWLTETQQSQFGNIAAWSGLLTALCEPEPRTVGIKLYQ